MCRVECHLSAHATSRGALDPILVARLSTLTNSQVHVIAAGGIYDGRGLAAMLMFGAQAVWVGTRFVAATEAAAPKKHKELYVTLR